MNGVAGENTRSTADETRRRRYHLLTGTLVLAVCFAAVAFAIRLWFF